MVRTLPIVRLVLAAALVLTAAPSAFAQPGNDVPAYLLARAAYEARTPAADPMMDLDAPDTTDAGARVAGDRVVWANRTQAAVPVKADFHVNVADGGQKRPILLPVLYVTLGALQGMDYYTTQKGLDLGAHETNAIVRNSTKGTFLAMKAGSTAVTILIAEKMWKKNKAGAIALMLATNVVYGAVVANNTRVIGQVR
ncbi:MAG: DUF5658 family protein [Vicinamibacterales bacterium]|nr:DUF5658 family protein [Vicinamibacterales bacterium]